MSGRKGRSENYVLITTVLQIRCRRTGALRAQNMMSECLQPEAPSWGCLAPIRLVGGDDNMSPLEISKTVTCTWGAHDTISRLGGRSLGSHLIWGPKFLAPGQALRSDEYSTGRVQPPRHSQRLDGILSQPRHRGRVSGVHRPIVAAGSPTRVSREMQVSPSPKSSAEQRQFKIF